MKKFITLCYVAVALAACSKGDDIPSGKMGTVAFDVATQTSITTRAEENKVELSTLGVTLPKAEEMILVITPPAGGYSEAITPSEYAYTGTVGSYNGEGGRDARKHYLPASNEPYRAKLSWGNQTSEGVDMAYFESRVGSGTDVGAEQGFIVGARQHNEVSLTAKMVKAIVRINFTNEFMGYFANGAEMTLTTAANNSFKVGYTADGTTTNINTPFFVLAGEGKSFSIAGKATKQRPATNINPETVAFTSINRAVVGEQMMYSYTFDVDNANNVTVTVDITNEPIHEIPVGTNEMNDDSVMDNN